MCIAEQFKHTTEASGAQHTAHYKHMQREKTQANKENILNTERSTMADFSKVISHKPWHQQACPRRVHRCAVSPGKFLLLPVLLCSVSVFGSVFSLNVVGYVRCSLNVLALCLL